MKCNVEGNELTIYLEGRIDSVNASSVEEEMNAVRSGNAHEALTIDMDNLEYISSAGLRILLRLIKEYKQFKIVNVKSDVYDVFEMTGFTEMADIQKAYRELSVEGCEIIGQGANGEVYRIDRDTIVKVYKDKDALPDIKRERELARCAFVLGVPTAIPYDVVRVNESYGSVFELLNSKSFAQLINENPDDVDKYIDMYVDLMKKIHSTVVKEDSMPSMKSIAINWVKYFENILDAEHYNKLYKLVDDVEENLHMMHGDYHIKNVMLQNGEALLIDMDTLCHGDPIFELASIFNAYIGYTMFDGKDFNSFMGIKKEVGKYIWRRTLELYLNTTDEDKIKEVADKASLIGFIRIMRRSLRRGITDYIEEYKKLVLELIDRLENLNI